MIPVHASASRVWTVRAEDQTGVLLLLETLSVTESKLSHAAPLAATRRAVGIGSGVQVGVVQGRRVVAVVQ